MGKPTPVPTLRSQIKWGLGGILFFLLFGAGSIALLTPLRFSGSPEEVNLCVDNLSRLQKAAALYAADHDGRTPGATWDRDLLVYESDPVVFACPRQRRIDPRSSGYALNEALIGKPFEELEPNAILFFDSRLTEKSAVGNPKDFPVPGRHLNGRANNVVYANGQSASIPAR